MPKTQKKPTLKDVQKLFNDQFLELYSDLEHTLWLIYSTVPKDKRSYDQRKFYATLFLYRKYARCLDNNNDLSQNILSYLNWFLFFWYDTKYLLWTAFGNDYHLPKFRSLDKLLELLYFINQQCFYYVEQAIPKIKPWILAYKPDITCLTFGYDLTKEKLPVNVLVETILTNHDYLVFYNALQTNRTLNVLKSTDQEWINTKYTTYFNLVQTHQLNRAYSEAEKSTFYKQWEVHHE